MGDTWKMQDGKEIKIAAMKDSHLLNTIAMLDRQESAVLAAVIGMPSPRGEMAQDAVASGVGDLAEQPYGMANPAYADLVNEAIRRGIYKVDK